MIDIYNKVREHLLNQNARSVEPGEYNCKYRSNIGLKCAIGCLIDDSIYNATLEGYTVYSTNVLDALAKSGISVKGPTNFHGYNDNRLLLLTLQALHDKINPEDWREALDHVGNSLKNNYPMVYIYDDIVNYYNPEIYYD